MTEPEKALVWMERITACLTWYQADGPPVPAPPAAAGSTAEERASWRRAEEWDEAYRSLENLLRQGVVSSFCIISERFGVTVLGEGSGSWKHPKTGKEQRPTSSEPLAVLCPSVDELRKMLQQNHVSFEVAELCGASAALAAPEAKGPVVVDLVPCADALPASAPHSTMEEIRSDLRELRRGGEKVVTPDEIGRVTPLSSALWFEGAWRVHALLDVLRQHFLAAPLASPAPSPPRLPRLVAPTAFTHASVRPAEVVKTQMAQAATAPGAAPPEREAQHSAELSGCFFPAQVRKLVELLRVLLPSFTCELLAEPRFPAGINAFTQLGMRRVEAVDCKCTGGGSDGTLRSWKWEFKLGAG